MSLAARIAAALALILAVLAGAWRIHVKADAAGYARAQGEHAAQALEASQAQRAQEQALARKTQEIDRAYQTEKARRAAAERALADSLRSFQAAGDSATATDPATPSRADDPWPRIARECAAALTALDGHAQRLAGQLGALQGYTGRVCVSPPD